MTISCKMNAPETLTFPLLSLLQTKFTLIEMDYDKTIRKQYIQRKQYIGRWLYLMSRSFALKSNKFYS